MPRQRKTKADSPTEFRLTPPDPESPGRRSTRPGDGNLLQEHFAYNYARLKIAIEAVERGKTALATKARDYMGHARSLGGRPGIS